MLPSRFGAGQSSAMRKSRLEGKPSLLPKPRRPGSTDRLSTEARRPSTAGHRSSSAEPRATYGGRLSREASATKLPTNGRSRSQQGERFVQSSMTPLRSSQYPARPTTTPVRTPSKDRSNYSWQASLDRALAFVTIKDQRPVSTAAWQRAEIARVSAALAERGVGATLVRPLTIARFVDIAGALIAAITRDARLNNDNYVTKLPHLLKRLLYPGTVSKSWLKVANTLHAFPQALALIAYLLDLVNHIEMPVQDEWLYVGKDEVSCLRRDYLHKCWIRFQDPGHQYEDLNEEYLQNLKALLGNDEEKIVELEQVIKKYETCLEDADEAEARAEEARLVGRRDALLVALRAVRRARRTTRADTDAQRAALTERRERVRALEAELERAGAENQQLKRELETQPLTVPERTRLLDELDYAVRVRDSKAELADQIQKMVVSKETELALWQKRALDACVEYKQGLIRLSAQFPHLAALTVDEKELMGTECANSVARAIEALRACSASLAEQHAQHTRSKTALARKRCALVEETRAKVSEIKISIQREQESLESERAEEAAEAVAWAAELRDLTARAEAITKQQLEYDRVDQELAFWEKQDLAWRTKLTEMHEYIEKQRVESQRLFEEARAKRVALVVDNIKLLTEKLKK